MSRICTTYYNYTYRSDGVKMREQSTHQYTKLVMKISASGDTTYVQRNASDTHFRAHYGNYVKETGQPDKIYNEEGYIALHGDSVSYHFFERDYLGSVRAVFDLYGNLEQTNDYNVTGIPSSRHLGNADVHKHTGKEFQGFNGLAWYDNNARYYDPILARFTTQDPLAEKYPWLSPYNHCANNPMRFVDRDGKEWTDNQNKVIENTSNINVFIFYVNDFKEQALIQYNDAIKQYGANSVAMSNTGTTSGFANDWENMAGNDIKKVLIMTHGKNQSIRVDNNDGNGVHQFTSTGNGKTNLTGSDAYDISNLGNPKGTISNATLYMYSCHSADMQAEAHGSGDHRQGALSGTMLPIAHRFAQKFNFSKVIGTQGAVNYNSFFTNFTTPRSSNYMRPYPEDGKWINIVRRK